MKKLVLLVIAIVSVLNINLMGKTKITWWQFWTDPTIKPVIENMVSEFEKANPDIEVELTDLTWANGHEKIVIAFSTGNGPDIVELGSDWIAELAHNGMLDDMTEAVADTKAEYQGWGMATYHDKVYAYPWFLGTRVLFANRDLLTKAGYDRDFIPTNWDNLKEAIYKVDSLSDKIYGWGSNTAEKHRLYKKFLPFFWGNDARFFSDDNQLCLIASDPAIHALQYYKELHDSCGYVGNQRGIEDAFLDGKIGFIISGDWLLKRIETEKRKFNLVSTIIPGPKYPGPSFMGGEFLAVNKESEHKDAAYKFIQFMTSPANQVAFCKANRSANPSSVEAQADPYFANNEHLQTFIKQLNLSKHPPVDPDWVYIESAFEEAIEDALFDSGLPGQALFKARKKIEANRSE